MASTEMVQIDPLFIFSSPTTPRTGPNLALNATLNSPAEGPVLSSAKGPTIEDLNQLNAKLTVVRLSSAQKLKEFAGHNIQGGERHGPAQNSPVSNLSRFRRDGGTPILTDFTGTGHGFGQSASSSFVPELQRGGGVPILLEVVFDCDAHFRPFYDDANMTPSTTVDGKTHGSGDDGIVRKLSAFRRSGGDRMSDDPTDLALYMHLDTSNNAAPVKITSHL